MLENASFKPSRERPLKKERMISLYEISTRLLYCLEMFFKHLID